MSKGRINTRQNRGTRRRLTARTVNYLRADTDRLSAELGVGQRPGISESEPPSADGSGIGEILVVMGAFALAGLVNIRW